MKKMQSAFAEKESEWRDQMTILKRELVAKDKKVQVAFPSHFLNFVHLVSY